MTCLSAKVSLTVTVANARKLGVDIIELAKCYFLKSVCFKPYEHIIYVVDPSYVCTVRLALSPLLF